MKRFVQATPPAFEPVTLEELKTFIRIDDDTEDNLLSLILSASRKACENYTLTSFITQKWECWMDFDFVDTILMYAPLQSVEEIKIYDTDNVSSIINASNYWLDIEGKRVIMKSTYTFPTIREYSGIVISYTAGYEKACDVPEPIKQAIIITAGSLYDCKSAGNAQIPALAKNLLAPYKDVAKLGMNYSA